MNDEEFVKAMDRETLVAAVNDEIRKYAAERNGLSIWRAYELCRAAGEPVPEVILRCLDDFAKALGSARNSVEIARAMGMEGAGYGGSALKHLRGYEESRHIVSAVQQYIDFFGARKSHAFKALAPRFGLTQSALQKRYYDWQKRQPGKAGRTTTGTRKSQSWVSVLPTWRE